MLPDLPETLRKLPRQVDSSKLIGAYPIDYLAWTAEVDGAEREASEGAVKNNVKSKELLIEGQVGPAAATVLKARGWTVSENVALAAQKSGEPAGSGITPAAVGSKIVR